MSVASSGTGWGPGVAQIGSCVCPCRSVSQVRLKPSAWAGSVTAIPCSHALLVRVGSPPPGGPGVRMGPGGRSRGRARPLPQWCRAQPRRTRRRRRVCAGRGRRPGDIRWRGGVVLRYWCSSFPARAAPLSDRPRHTRCRRESSPISVFDRYGPATPAAPLTLEVSTRFLSSVPALGVR